MNLRLTLSIAVVCLALSLSAFADNVSVSCTIPHAGTFSSIAAALNSLNPAGPNVITVQGLTIQSAFGQTAVNSKRCQSGRNRISGVRLAISS